MTKKYKKLFYEMLRIRKVEESISKNYSKWKMRCPVHLSIGQEAPAVGVIKNLLKQDKIVTAHRSHAHYLAKGGNLKASTINSHGDHRIAMAASIGSLRSGGETTILDCLNVNTSFPNFIDVCQELGINIEKI